MIPTESGPTLTLVGLPAAGKTTVGRLLAERWELPLVDVADLIEQRIGGSTAEFLAVNTEDAYRAIEAEIALAALARPGIVALSSGAVEDADVRTALAGPEPAAPVIWLRTSVQSLTRRLGMSLLGMDALVSIRNRMDAMASQRAGWYAAVATAVVDTDRLSPSEVAEAVVTIVGGER